MDYLSIGLLLLVVVLVIWLIATYNRLVRLRVQSENAWSDIDVQLKRRHDLIPNLVETVKGYASHEKETLRRVIEARNQAISAQAPSEKAQAEEALTHALKSIFALSESYPQLRAVESFTQLQGTLQQIEEAVQNARRYYNAVVRDFNTQTAVFPANLVAGTMGFQSKEFFEAPLMERAVPKVDFGGGG